VAAGMFAGCGGPQVAPPGAVQQSSARTNGMYGRSWMLPEARSETLLYIGDPGSGGVLVYTYLPALKFVGVLVTPSDPGGECVDKAQNVFVTDRGPGSHVTYEYAHAGTSPIAILGGAGGTPSSCAVDPTTGDLAVTSARSSTSHGKVAIYKGAKGTPKLFADFKFYDILFCGYDDKGNLYVDGSNEPSGNGFLMAELPKGGNALSEITLNQTIFFPGGVEWDGKHVAVGDERIARIYQFAINEYNGKKVGTTRLRGLSGIYQFFIFQGLIVDPSYVASGGTVGIYRYPTGGKTIRTVTGVSSPYGAIVSLPTNMGSP
jgi:hypothetical protein